MTHPQKTSDISPISIQILFQLPAPFGDELPSFTCHPSAHSTVPGQSLRLANLDIL